MIGRRDFLGLLAGLPFVGTAAALNDSKLELTRGNYAKVLQELSDSEALKSFPGRFRSDQLASLLSHRVEIYADWRLPRPLKVKRQRQVIRARAARTA